MSVRTSGGTARRRVRRGTPGGGSFGRRCKTDLSYSTCRLHIMNLQSERKLNRKFTVLLFYIDQVVFGPREEASTTFSSPRN